MSKHWYYEAMGSPVGPITSAELKACVLSKRITPETRIRLGDDGKWQTADRVKGLFDAAAPVAKPTPAPAKPATQAAPASPVAKVQVSAIESPTAELAAADTAEITIRIADVRPALAPAQATLPSEEDDSDKEYDFFKFVGFENAIGHALNEALKEHCRVNHCSMTQATKRALAEFLKRKDLIGEAAPAPAAAAVESVGVG
jgi:hypothetical protein